MTLLSLSECSVTVKSPLAADASKYTTPEVWVRSVSEQNRSALLLLIQIVTPKSVVEAIAAQMVRIPTSKRVHRWLSSKNIFASIMKRYPARASSDLGM